MKRIQCHCGRVLALPEGKAVKFRCPACGAILRVRTAPAPAAAPRASAKTQAQAAPEPEYGEYEIVDEPQAPVTPQGPSPASQPANLFVPSERVTKQARRRERTFAASTAIPENRTADEYVVGDDFPGPFIDRTALLYPFLHPTWMCSIGLSFFMALTLGAIFCTAFFFTIIMTFGAFASLFTFATMVMVCVALTGYLFTTFENVYEYTAGGENRLDRLPGLSFSENLPPFMRMVGAALSTAAAGGAIVYLLRNHLGQWETEEWAVNPWVVLRMYLIFDLVTWAVFPIFVISNSVEQSWIPIWALHTTVLRLLGCAWQYVLFLILSAVASIAMHTLLAILRLIHVSLVLVFIGPLFALYMLYYAHWLGRVVRQMMAIEASVEVPRWVVRWILAPAGGCIVAAIAWWAFATFTWGPSYTVSDGKYVMKWSVDLRGRNARIAQHQVELRKGNDGSFELFDNEGEPLHVNGKIKRGEVEFMYHLEGLAAESRGRVTGNDTLEGTGLVKLPDGFDEDEEIQKELKWTLVRKK